MGKLTGWLKNHLKLTVNEAKSAVARPWERKFLGYGLTRVGKLKIAAPSIVRFKGVIREALRGARGRSLVATIRRLNPKLTGWMAYFRLTETKRALEDLDGWIRRRLRSLLWRQWKRVYTRARRLISRGLDRTRAWQSATNGRGAWWNSGPPICMRRSPRRAPDPASRTGSRQESRPRAFVRPCALRHRDKVRRRIRTAP
jgi:hypothetical protein